MKKAVAESVLTLHLADNFYYTCFHIHYSECQGAILSTSLVHLKTGIKISTYIHTQNTLDRVTTYFGKSHISPPAELGTFSIFVAEVCQYN